MVDDRVGDMIRKEIKYYLYRKNKDMERLWRVWWLWVRIKGI